MTIVLRSVAVASLPFAATATWGFSASMVLATAGILLLYLECNRPGRVLPGAAGLLLLLLAAYSLSLLPLRPASLLLVVAGFLTLAAPLRLEATWRPLLAGTALLILGFATLSASEAVSATAGICGLVLGPVTAWLTIIAGRARRAKRRLRQTFPEARTAVLLDRWE